MSSFTSWVTPNPDIITLLPGPFVKVYVGVYLCMLVSIKAIGPAVHLSPEAKS